MLIVTPASVSDVDSILPVMAGAFSLEFGEAWSASQCISMLALPGSHFTIASLNEKVVGFAIMRLVLDEAELLLIAVDPHFQGEGVGNKLLQHVLTESFTFGARKLHVEVRSDNEARDFYSKRGFAEVGMRPNYYRRKDGGPTEAISLVHTFTS